MKSSRRGNARYVGIAKIAASTTPAAGNVTNQTASPPVSATAVVDMTKPVSRTSMDTPLVASSSPNRARLVPLKTRDAATAAIPRNRPHPRTLGAHGTARRSAKLGTDSSPQRTTVSCHHGRLHKVCRHAERYPDCAKHQTDQAPYALGGRSAEVDRDEDSKKRERVDQTDRNREVVRAYSSYDGKRFGDI